MESTSDIRLRPRPCFGSLSGLSKVETRIWNDRLAPFASMGNAPRQEFHKSHAAPERSMNRSGNLPRRVCREPTLWWRQPRSSVPCNTVSGAEPDPSTLHWLDGYRAETAPASEFEAVDAHNHGNRFHVPPPQCVGTDAAVFLRPSPG